MRHTKYILMIILVSLLASSFVAGQKRAPARKNGKIQGVVLDRNDARIVTARIIIEGPQFKRELRTGDQGEFEIQLPAGVYSIKAQANGFRNFELSPFTVKANVTELINIHMEVGALSQ